MADAPDWVFRANFLDEQAAYLEAKAEDLKSEAARYRGLAEQARFVGCQRQQGETRN